MGENIQASSDHDAPEITSRPSLRHHRTGLSQIISDTDLEDATARYRLEAADNEEHQPGSSSSSIDNGRTIISFMENDPENPYNWSTRRKIFIVFTGVTTVINSTAGSALPSNALPYLAPYFHVSMESGNPQLVLPISIYLIGYVLGPLLFGPLSESFGRKRLMMITFAGYTLFTLACALAPSWAALIVFRLITGMCASAPITVVGGLYADIYNNPVTRGRAMAIFMAATCFGPLTAPIISGFLAPINWRWTFWAGLIIAGASWIPMLFLPETYGPIILSRRATQIRKEALKTGKGNPETYAPLDLETKGFKHMVGVVLTRPIRMFVKELIVMATCLFLAVAYAIFYMYFEAYPIVFQDIYGMSTGVSGLMFLPIGVGACISVGIFLMYDSFLERAKRAGKAWTQKEESRRLPLACLGGPLYVVSMLWLGWSARSDVHWVVPMLAGIPFGMGFLLIFMALLNYLTDAYEIFAASAMAASSCCRSVFGAILPLATTPMYNRLGVGWASSLLAFLSLAMSVIPFLFIRYGETIRGRSEFCQYLKEKKAQEEEEVRQHRLRRLQQETEADKDDVVTMSAPKAEDEKV